jgi:hypothetical protein
MARDGLGRQAEDEVYVKDLGVGDCLGVVALLLLGKHWAYACAALELSLHAVAVWWMDVALLGSQYGTVLKLFRPFKP